MATTKKSTTAKKITKAAQKPRFVRRDDREVAVYMTKNAAGARIFRECRRNENGVQPIVARRDVVYADTGKPVVVKTRVTQLKDLEAMDTTLRPPSESEGTKRVQELEDFLRKLEAGKTEKLKEKKKEGGRMRKIFQSVVGVAAVILLAIAFFWVYQQVTVGSVSSSRTATTTTVTPGTAPTPTRTTASEWTPRDRAVFDRVANRRFARSSGIVASCYSQQGRIRCPSGTPRAPVEAVKYAAFQAVLDSR